MARPFSSRLSSIDGLLRDWFVAICLWFEVFSWTELDLCFYWRWLKKLEQSHLLSLARQAISCSYLSKCSELRLCACSTEDSISSSSKFYQLHSCLLPENCLCPSLRKIQEAYPPLILVSLHKNLIFWLLVLDQSVLPLAASPLEFPFPFLFCLFFRLTPVKYDFLW